MHFFYIQMLSTLLSSLYLDFVKSAAYFTAVPALPKKKRTRNRRVSSEKRYILLYQLTAINL